MKRAPGKSEKKRPINKSRWVVQIGQKDISRIVSGACSKFNLNFDQTQNVLSRVLAQFPAPNARKRSVRTRRRHYRWRTEKVRLHDELPTFKSVYIIAEKLAREISEVHFSTKPTEVFSRKSLEPSYSPSVQKPRVPFDTEPVTRLISEGSTPNNNLDRISVSLKVNRALDCQDDRVKVKPTNISAAEFAEGSVRDVDINITAMDIPVTKLAQCKALYRLKSLNMSRLDLTDQMIVAFFSLAHLNDLRWLDLSGNRHVTEVGVRSICESVKIGLLPRLDWLNLIGTSFDATPYIDGHYWRISNNARKLAEKFGYQRWMMLGSRNPDLENYEVLSTHEISFPPGMFRSA